MNYLRTFKIILLILLGFAEISQAMAVGKIKFFGASKSALLFTGRVDFSDPALPRFYSPGVYVQGRFKGTSCELEINDELLYGTSHNYITVVVDNGAPKRIKLTERKNRIRIADQLGKGEHRFLLCKSTESGIGYIELAGIWCERLLPAPEALSRKIEFIGNSITCGMGNDLTIPCGGSSTWYDQHNAYMSYGPVVSRILKADWALTAVSGIGLIHSCCDMTITMPQVFDKINLRENTGAWDFNLYQPDVVTVCLGQNDGVQDSAAFCNAYEKFIKTLRGHYPKASIVCLTSPMADSTLRSFMTRSITSVISKLKGEGEQNVYKFVFTKRYHKGCTDHPDLAEHQEIAQELSAVLRKIKNW